MANPTTDALRATALAHHEAGRAVIAIRENKKPYREGWNEYFMRPQTKSEVMDHFSNGAHGVAMVLWPACTFAVLDFDGVHAQEAWDSTGIELPETTRNRTRSGGVHLYFKMPVDLDLELKRKVRLVKAECSCPKSCGVDLLLHGYAIIPPTPGYHEDPDHPLEDAVLIPHEILALAAQHENKTAEKRTTGDADGRVRAGERNATLVSLAGTMKKRGMSIDAIRAALKTDNEARFDPPVDDEEIESVLKSAERWPHGATNDTNDTNKGLNQTIRPEIDSVAFYGLAGEIARTIDPYSESDPVASLVNTVTAFGNVIGSGPYFLVDKTEHHMNLFVVEVGKSSKARKGLSWSTPRYLFKQVDQDWGEKRIQGGLSSGEGLVYAVRDARSEQKPYREKGKIAGYETVIVDEGIEDKRLLCVEEEFAQVLKVSMRDGNIVSMIIRSAWDGARLAPMTKNSPIQATNAHISIIGHITKDELLRHLTDTEQANGFANRFLWLFLERSKFIDNPIGVPNEKLEPLIYRLRDAVDFARKTTLMRRDEGAAAVWRDGYRELSEEKTGLVGSITARGEAQVMRLACLYALLDQSALIRVEHLKAAAAVWKYSEKCAGFIFGDSQGDPTVDRIIAGLKRAPMTETDIAGLFNRHSYKEIDRALAFISNNGMAKPEIEETGGRPRTVWKLCSGAQKAH